MYGVNINDVNIKNRQGTLGLMFHNTSTICLYIDKLWKIKNIQ